MGYNPKHHDTRVVGRSRIGITILESRCGLRGMDVIPAGNGLELTCERCKALLAKDATTGGGHEK
jgi:hypothetical protein